MIRPKTKEEIATLREGGKRLAHIVHTLAAAVAPGVISSEIEAQARKMFEESGGEPAFLHYQPRGSHRPYPGFVCVSVNDVIVHGIADENPITFQEGDLVTVDGGLRYEGLITDMAVTIGAGSLSDEHQNLVHVAQVALERGIEAVTLGGHVGDIGAAIESFVSNQGFALAEDLAGHGVGYEVHEDPFVPNTGFTGEGAELVSGLVIAIEPMVIVGNSGAVEFSNDGFTVFTARGAMSAHFEHTVAVTEAGPEILTLLE